MLDAADPVTPNRYDPEPPVTGLWICMLLFPWAVLVWAPIRAKHASKLGYDTGKYWAPFWVAMVVIIIGLLIATAPNLRHTTTY